jgi:hypothetical protein
MTDRKAPKLEIKINWFDQWKLHWSCDQTSWNSFAHKLKSPLAKAIAIGTGIAIGVGAVGYSTVNQNQLQEMSPANASAPRR